MWRIVGKLWAGCGPCLWRVVALQFLPQLRCHIVARCGELWANCGPTVGKLWRVVGELWARCGSYLWRVVAPQSFATKRVSFCGKSTHNSPTTLHNTPTMVVGDLWSVVGRHESTGLVSSSQMSLSEAKLSQSSLSVSRYVKTARVAMGRSLFD